MTPTHSQLLVAVRLVNDTTTGAVQGHRRGEGGLLVKVGPAGMKVCTYCRGAPRLSNGIRQGGSMNRLRLC